MAGPEEGVFADCAITFVPTRDLSASMVADLSSVVVSNGATVVEPRRGGDLDLQKVTHIVANSIDFPQYFEAQAMLIPVVTADWITYSIARHRLGPLRHYSPDPRMIFSKVHVACAGLPILDMESICGAVVALGGQESKDIVRTTTHICALTMDDPAVRTAIAKGSKAAVVLPHWFDDCFKLGKRIDEKPYLLPNAEILHSHDADEKIHCDAPEELAGATSAKPDFKPPRQDESGRQPLTVFARKYVVLSPDLGITARLRKIISELIDRGGGRVIDDVNECDMLICQYRHGDDYVRAAKAGKDVGNLSWLYHLIINNEWTSPMRRLLHYPLPKEPLPGFENFRITVSNYGGDARIYIENLIKATGATFTKSMKNDNTHLITARNNSEKCEAALDWNVTMVNHLWLEESYAKCEAQAVTMKKYTHFPPRTNLGEIIGRTMLEERKIQEKYYPASDSESDSEDASKPRRVVVEASHENAHRAGPAEGAVANTGRAKREFNVLEDSVGPKGRKSKHTEKADAKPTTPARTRRAITGKENNTPSLSTGGRSAKSKALSNLQQIAPDVDLYEKEKRRASKDGKGPWGGKRAADRIDKEKRKKGEQEEEEQESESSEEDVDEKRPAKRQRPSLPGVDMRVLVTSYARWNGDKSKEDRERRKLREMGIQIVQDGQPCDYLAAPNLVRTVKFLRGLARGPTVINSNFIDEVLDRGEMLDPEDFVLKDPAKEKEMGVKLAKSVARARAYKGRLLQGVPIYCTAMIRMGYEPFQQIAEANGAIFKVYRARGGTTIRPTTAEEDGGAPPDPVYLLSSWSPEEKMLWPKFREMAEAGHMEARIVASDWLLDVAMKQEVSFDDRFLVENFKKA